MKTVFQVFDSANLDRCRFYIGMTSFLVFFFFFIAMILQDSFWLILAGAAILGWLAAMAFWLRKRQNIRAFLQAHPLHEPYRCIDTTFFSEQEILSASLDRLTACTYSEVIRVFHNDNPWEKTRPGYKGLHSVSLETQKGAILVRVSDAQKAELLTRWIKGKKEGNCTVHLEELGNWSVKTRF